MGQLVVFISYSWSDGEEFAIELRDRLRNISQPVAPWIDRDNLHGRPFSTAIEEAIGGCDVLLFVLTRDSVLSDWCKDEIVYARHNRKWILPLRVHDDAELPIEIVRLAPIDFPEDQRHNRDWRKLEAELAFYSSPEGRLQFLEEERRLLLRDAARADDTVQSQRYERDLADLDERMQEERSRSDKPEISRRLVMDAVGLDQRRERTSEAASVNRSGGIRSVNDPAPLPPNQFHDRVPQIQQLEDRLSDSSTRLVAVVGPGGIGKTAMVSRLLDGLRRNPQRLPVDAFIYLPAHGSRLIRPAILLEDLRKVVPDRSAADDLAERLNNSALTLPDKLDEVLEELSGTRVIVVIDNAEELLDADGQLRDRELDALVKALLRRRDHAVTLVLATREAPDPLIREFASAVRLDLDSGLPRADAYDYLHRLDSQGILGLQSAPEEHLERVYRHTRGSPRALEAIYSILEAEPGTSLAKLLIDMDELRAGQDMLRYLIGRMLDRPDLIDRRVMQALAVYGRPVSPAAVDELLSVHIEGLQSERTLHRLLARRLIRQDGERFYLPSSPDGERLLAIIPWGETADRDRKPAQFTQLALLHRAAGYFAATRKSRVEHLDDLSAEFAEIDLRMRGRDYQAALQLISEIDESYLNGWGYSEAVAHWREELMGKLDGPAFELYNLAWLANARRQQEEYPRAIEHLDHALEYARRPPNQSNEPGLLITLATTYYDNGQPTIATDRYVQALNEARRRQLPLEEAQALEGLALCEGETGQFREALEHHAAALAMTKDLQGRKSQLFEAELYLNIGCLHGRRGHLEEAFEWLRKGQELASPLGDDLLNGHFLSSEALVLIDDGDLVRAIELATEAIAIGASTRNSHLSREGNMTLAEAYLCQGDLDAASGAADAAARYRRSRRALGAYVLQGITAFRKGLREKAYVGFLDAHLQAETLRRREGRNYEVLDADGLALCGLALCGDQEQLNDAVSTYRAARKVTCEQGVVRRSLRLLRELGRSHEEPLAHVRRAAGGR
jgi:tetratricopeptide (TPR) repeat protein